MVQKTAKERSTHKRREQLMGTRKKQCTQCEHLATYILENYPQEVGRGDPVHGESAVSVAIRLLQELLELRGSVAFHCVKSKAEKNMVGK